MHSHSNVIPKYVTEEVVLFICVLIKCSYFYFQKIRVSMKLILPGILRTIFYKPEQLSKMVKFMAQILLRGWGRGDTYVQKFERPLQI